MPKRKLLFIVGAGASKEANIPTGEDLKEKIANLLDIRFEHGYTMISGDRLIFEAIKKCLNYATQQEGMNAYQSAYWRIRDAMPQAISIDNFIDTHNENQKIEFCGKLAIVRSILEAEKDSLLFFDDLRGERLNYNELKLTWYNKFWKMLTENCQIDNLDDRLESIALIIFNYDRTIEHFLYNSLQNYYGLDHSKAAELVKKIEIYHPYGVVGYLPWQGYENSVAFGAESNANLLLKLAGEIKTFAEGTDPDSSEVKKIRRKIPDAEKIVFLGFAFHQLNMELIGPTEYTNQASQYFATVKGLSSSDCEIIKRNLVERCKANKHNIFMEDITCEKLFDEYKRALALT